MRFKNITEALDAERRLKRELRILRIEQGLKYFLLLCFGIIVGVVITLLPLLPMPHTSTEMKTVVNVSFDGLNETQILNVMKVVSTIKPEYLNSYTRITVTDDMNKYQNDTNGYNSGNGNITVGYFYCWNIVTSKNCTESEYYFRRLLCHELLHSSVEGEHEEEVVLDLQNTFSCFNDVSISTNFPDLWK